MFKADILQKGKQQTTNNNIMGKPFAALYIILLLWGEGGNDVYE